MALAFRHRSAKSDVSNVVPISSVYSQSWPVPNPNFTAKNDSFSSGRSLNKDWIRPSGRQDFISSTRDGIAAPKGSTRGAKSPSSKRNTSVSNSLFLEESEDEIDDTVQEFKITLQLFKRLTQQVREVNQYMHNHRIYSFKHHLNNEGIGSPALRRSQLAAALSRREIPATQGPNDPITDLGPLTLITRPSSRQDRKTRSPSPVSRTSSPTPTAASRPASALSCYRSGRASAKSIHRTADMDRRSEHEMRQADDKAKEGWIAKDEQFEQLFVPAEINPDDIRFRFHNPYPQTWVDETVEVACFRESKKAVDPFMHRLTELEDVQEETVLWEKLIEEKAKQTVVNIQNKTGTKKSKNSSKLQPASRGGRSQSAKSGGAHLPRPKSHSNKLNRVSSAKNGSTTSNPISGDESDITTFRNSGYNMDVSFILGSMYPETRSKEKQKVGKLEKSKRVVSAPLLPIRITCSPPPSLETKITRPPYCEACRLRAASAQKHTCAKSVVPTLRSMRAEYELKASECYDIVELARTLDLPCRIPVNKPKARHTAEEKATSKGLVPGKSTFSQRRISLTAEGMNVRGINPTLKMVRPSTGRCKSAKRSVKRR